MDDQCFGFVKLYLIEILHQTTTFGVRQWTVNGCILSKFYIKPQPYDLSLTLKFCCILSKFYIKPQLAISDKLRHQGCILSKFYIKPQPDVLHCLLFVVVSYRNSTSNHNRLSDIIQGRWVVSYRNSTSNHNYYDKFKMYASVVSYRNSTSNHNRPQYSSIPAVVVSYRNSTSNHNVGPHIDW